jgi:hypothetical protein
MCPIRYIALSRKKVQKMIKCVHYYTVYPIEYIVFSIIQSDQVNKMCLKGNNVFYTIKCVETMYLIVYNFFQHTFFAQAFLNTA